MIFEIDRASIWGNAQPCNEAYKVEEYRPDNCGNTKKFTKYEIKIDTLEDLMEIVKREKRIIISKSYTSEMPHIMIYDDYVE